MGNSGKGWIRLYRQSTDNPLYFSEPFDKWHAWQDLLLMANHERRQFFSKGQLITLEPGQMLTSIRILAKRWAWSENKVRRFLRTLNGSGMCTQDGTPSGTRLTLVNWAKFQPRGHTDEYTDGRPDEYTDGRPDGTLTRMYNKNVKNVQEERARPSRFQPPTFEAVSEYFAQIGCGSDPQLFIDYYAARGWRLSRGAAMADWKAAARSWKKRSNEKGQKRSNNRFDNFPERDYSSGDLEELERMLNAKPI